MEESPSRATLSSSANKSSIGDPQLWDRSLSPATQSQPTISALYLPALTHFHLSHLSQPIAWTPYWESCPDTFTRPAPGTTVKTRTSTSEKISKSASLAGPSSGVSAIPSRSTASKPMSLASTQPEAVVVAAVSGMGIVRIPAIARATSTSLIDCPFCAGSSPFTRTHTPMMIQVPSLRLAEPSGTRVFISRGYPSCRTWTCASKPSVHMASLKTSVHIISSQTANTSTEIPTKASWLATQLAGTLGPLKAAPAIGSPPAHVSRQAIGKTSSRTVSY